LLLLLLLLISEQKILYCKRIYENCFYGMHRCVNHSQHASKHLALGNVYKERISWTSII
jgi:hypothetical protein